LNSFFHAFLHIVNRLSWSDPIQRGDRTRLDLEKEQATQENKLAIATFELQVQLLQLQQTMEINNRIHLLEAEVKLMGKQLEALEKQKELALSRKGE
jgi:hypothetical protein